MGCCTLTNDKWANVLGGRRWYMKQNKLKIDDFGKLTSGDLIEVKYSATWTLATYKGEDKRRPNTHYLVTYANTREPYGCTKCEATGSKNNSDGRQVSDGKCPRDNCDGDWYHKKFTVPKTTPCRSTNGHYIYYGKKLKRWYMCDKNNKLLYATAERGSETPPKKKKGWLKQYRRRLKSRAELLAERFARHCATVARR